MELLDKIETIVKVAKELEKVATKLIKEIDAFIELITAEPEEKKPVVEASKKVITLEEVRSYLTNLSRDGHTKEVKELLVKYGANRLSDVKEEDYEALLHDAEAITNA